VGTLVTSRAPLWLVHSFLCWLACCCLLRYFAETSATLFTTILGQRTSMTPAGQAFKDYWLSDGTYGSFRIQVLLQNEGAICASVEVVCLWWCVSGCSAVLLLLLLSVISSANSTTGRQAQHLGAQFVLLLICIGCCCGW